MMVSPNEKGKAFMRRLIKLINNTLTVAREGNVIFLAERLMKKEDGSYIPHLFLTLPLGPTRLQKFLFAHALKWLERFSITMSAPNVPSVRLTVVGSRQFLKMN